MVENEGYMEFDREVPEIELIETRDVTPAWQNTKNNLNLRWSQFSLIPFCILYLRPRCRKESWISKIIPPGIFLKALPIKLTDVNVYLLKGKISGKIVSKADNSSTEGYTYEENAETGEKRNVNYDEKSDELTGGIRKTLNSTNIGKKIVDTMGNMPRVYGGSSTEVSGTFETGGLLDFIQELLRYLITGKIDINGTLTGKINWEFLGKPYSKSTAWDVQGKLPVSNVRWGLW